MLYCTVYLTEKEGKEIRSVISLITYSNTKKALKAYEYGDFIPFHMEIYLKKK